jgi:signal transduction histidine kinase
LKYSSPDSPIVISTHPTEEHRGEIEVVVRDYGLGVPPRDAPKLFNRFVRLERDIGGPVRGTGLGLYLCRILVEAMGGRIWIESSGVPGEGSAFCFTLVAAHSAPMETASDPAEAPPVDMTAPHA